MLSYGTEPLEAWVRDRTGGAGADLLIDSLPTGAPVSATMDGIKSLRRGGCGVSIGAMAEILPLDPVWFMCNALQWKGSAWFSVAEGEDMAAMADAGTLDLSKFEQQTLCALWGRKQDDGVFERSRKRPCQFHR